jgi:Zn-dependent peptidase ImmA (M78 family)
MIRHKLISEMVTSLLNGSGITRPQVDVKGLAESKGALVVEEPNEDETSGFLFQAAGSPPIIGVNANHHPNRKRFTVGHELAHLLLHTKTGVHVDRAVLKMRDARAKEGTDEEEIEANKFAAELLMPESFLRADIAELGQIYADDERAISELARRYGVSAQAMAIRLSSLNLVWI